jgi:hypothetical protein
VLSLAAGVSGSVVVAGVVAVESAVVSVEEPPPPQAVKKAKEIAIKAIFNVDFIILKKIKVLMNN